MQIIFIKNSPILNTNTQFFGRAKHNFAFLINSKLTQKKSSQKHQSIWYQCRFSKTKKRKIAQNERPTQNDR